MPSSTSIMRAGLLAASAASASSVIQSRQMTTTDCAAVHLFLARGNTEPYPGRQSVLVAEVCDRVADCDYEDIVFKDGADDVYSESIYEGATNGYNQVNAYNARCPDAKLVISGYSQGGHVVSDILAGGGGSFFGSTEPGETPAVSASSAAGKAIKAVTTFGNVRHTPDQPYNYGTGSANTSSNPRDEAQQAILLTYANVWRDYCQIGDPVCAHGDVRTDHTNYFDLFTYGAAEWIVSKLSEDSAATSSVASSSAAATPVASVPASSTPASSAEPVSTADVTTSALSSSAPASTVVAISAPTTTVVASSAPTTTVVASSAPTTTVVASSAPASSAPANSAPVSSAPTTTIVASSAPASSAPASSASVTSVAAYPVLSSSAAPSSTLATSVIAYPTQKKTCGGKKPIVN